MKAFHMLRSGGWTALGAILLAAVGAAHCARIPSELTPSASIPRPAGTSTQSPQSARDENVLPAATRVQISAAIGHDQPSYHAVAAGRGFRMTDATETVSADLTPDGVDFRHGVSHWAMALRAYGSGDTLRDVVPVTPTAAVNRVEYRRVGLTEWYVNGPLGLEQGFTLDRAIDNAT